jgi:hypothetical protein
MVPESRCMDTAMVKLYSDRVEPLEVLQEVRFFYKEILALI